MEDYERELYGVEDDDFDSQFAAELEVLAELEGGCELVPGSSGGSRLARGVREGCWEGRGTAKAGRQEPPLERARRCSAAHRRSCGCAVCADGLP